MDNTFNMSEITITKSFQARCYLGDQWFTAEVSAFVDSPSKIPDYIDLDNELSKLNGCSLTIEELCQDIHLIICHAFGSPAKVAVEVGQGKHMPVMVTKEGEPDEA